MATLETVKPLVMATPMLLASSAAAGPHAVHPRMRPELESARNSTKQGLVQRAAARSVSARSVPVSLALALAKPFRPYLATHSECVSPTQAISGLDVMMLKKSDSRREKESEKMPYKCRKLAPIFFYVLGVNDARNVAIHRRRVAGPEHQGQQRQVAHRVKARPGRLTGGAQSRWNRTAAIAGRVHIFGGCRSQRVGVNVHAASLHAPIDAGLVEMKRLQ